MSGMLAPVGIGITGALLIVGALYSIRMIHRKRRNSFKHQRRKVRQPEVSAFTDVFMFSFIWMDYLQYEIGFFICLGIILFCFF